MKTARTALLLSAVLLALPGAHGQNGSTQDKGQPDANSNQTHEAVVAHQSESGTPIKLQVVISEFDGSNKVSSLPYTLYTPAERPPASRGGPPVPINSMRYDVQTWIATDHGGTRPDNVFTDIDYGAYERSEGKYEVSLVISRSWVEMAGADDGNLKVGSVSGGQALLPRFRGNFSLMLTNGQTVDAVSVADPVTGHILKVDVTLTVLK